MRASTTAGARRSAEDASNASMSEASRSRNFFADAELRVDNRKNSPWAAEYQGFSVHAGVSFGTLDRKGREMFSGTFTSTRATMDA